jgi:hypothetical protein
MRWSDTVKMYEFIRRLPASRDRDRLLAVLNREIEILKKRHQVSRRNLAIRRH